MTVDDKNGRTVNMLSKEIVRLLTPAYGAGEAKAMMRLIFHHLKGWTQTDLMIMSDRPVSQYMIGKVNEILARVDAGEPIQYVVGEARFYGMDLEVTPAVLIPRPETSELVDMIVHENEGSDLRVLDVGTGSGAIAIALARNLRFPVVTAIDISADALEVARANADRLHARIGFIAQDVFLYEPAPDSFDIIVSNPPYIAEHEKKDMDNNVLDFEPAAALFVPDDNPLIYYSRISEIGRKSLSPGGRLYFEINPDYAAQLEAMLKADGYEDVRIVEDISHRPRFACAVQPK